MKNLKNIMWGLVLITIGTILGTNILKITNIDIFFDGWWTLLIIVPTFIGLCTERDKKTNLIFLIIGILLLLAARDILDFKILIKMILPIILIIIGLYMIFRNMFNKKMNQQIKKLNNKLSSNERYVSTFSEQNISLDDEIFKGTNLNATFGGIKLDLRKAIIKEDVVINVSATFGGIDIYIPDNVKIKIKSNSIFGGVSNRKKDDKNESKHTIYINASCVFGGVEIK